LAENLALIRQYAQEEGRELPPNFEVALSYNIHVNEDSEAAFAESKRFLDAYYTTNYSRTYLENRVAFGSPQQCIDKLNAYIQAGATTITLRLTSYSQDHQFERVTNEILPAFR
jgi:alkanesulfonate monooxygenase SsuD/methylene tetrahydromethanopterin reductase-like flavin-dependent oxidoreductase (luciferase family)